MVRPSSIIRITTPIDEFFMKWLAFFKPCHRMTDREMSVAAAFLRERYNLSKVITDEKLLEENVMNEATRKRIRESCNVSQAFFHGLMGDLRKKKFIVNGNINPRYIPHLEESQETVSIMVLFEFKEEEGGTDNDVRGDN